MPLKNLRSMLSGSDRPQSDHRMKLSDPHCHLYFDAYDQDRHEVIERAFQSGLQFLINVGIDKESNLSASDMADVARHIYSTSGWHPHSAEVDPHFAQSDIEKYLNKPSNVAVGEIGLDYYRNKAPKPMQIDLFRTLSFLAARHKKPIVIHSRDAFDDTVSVLREVMGEFPDLSAVFHCYTYDISALEVLLKMNVYISFTGIVTFNSASDLHEVAREVPCDRFMIETDAPYLTPVPNRGKRNEPSMVRYVAEKIAELKKMNPEEVALHATRNSADFFGIDLTR